MNQPTNPPKADRPDGIAGLAKMSTTAGLGHEYRAVSALAVVALVIAVFSSAAMLVDVLIVVPLSAFLLAVIALVRIKQSGGTLTGSRISGVAIVKSGMVLAVAGSALFGRISQDRSDTAAINQTVADLRTALIQDDYATAYGVTAQRFRDQIPAAFWAEVFSGMQSVYGNLTDVQTTGLINFSDEENGVRYARTQLVFTVENREEPLRHNAVFTREGDGPWELSSLADVFE